MTGGKRKRYETVRSSSSAVILRTRRNPVGKAESWPIPKSNTRAVNVPLRPPPRSEFMKPYSPACREQIERERLPQGSGMSAEFKKARTDCGPSLSRARQFERRSDDGPATQTERHDRLRRRRHRHAQERRRRLRRKKRPKDGDDRYLHESQKRRTNNRSRLCRPASAAGSRLQQLSCLPTALASRSIRL